MFIEQEVGFFMLKEKDRKFGVCVCVVCFHKFYKGDRKTRQHYEVL